MEFPDIETIVRKVAKEHFSTAANPDTFVQKFQTGNSIINFTKFIEDIMYDYLYDIATDLIP